MAKAGAWVHLHADADERVGADVWREGSDLVVHFTNPGGHASHRAQVELVDMLFALPQAASSHHLHATMPIGESELLLRLSRHCTSLHTRAAGTTCVLDADLGTSDDEGAAR